jgi:CheY-like chemotaxis protein
VIGLIVKIEHQDDLHSTGSIFASVKGLMGERRWLAFSKEHSGAGEPLSETGEPLTRIMKMANILIIDNEESIRFSFHRFLSAKGKGHSVIIAEGYVEALSRMDKMEFDLILADIILDDGWGIDILQEVMRRNLKTRVIIMTAYPTEETVQASFRMKAIDYLVKPLSQERLLYFVTKSLRKIEKDPPLRAMLLT